MRKAKREEQRTHPDDSGPKPDAESEEDLQPKDPGEIPRAPQNPVNPGPEVAS